MFNKTLKIKFLPNDLLRTYYCNSHHHWTEEFDRNMKLISVNLKGRCNCHMTKNHAKLVHSYNP